ncbi:unnamed protein product [Lepeophtheirus salmonis]|uniref:(salmon louse) hypothetical protein n=1 Tax=Lepeophtheirus salmonis TaxID=72036 RepID=A0A7R8H120_LEPSM|nr:unnamed protein product [Lepeophtheirus salmonis]CAF2780158.1 unnamed protein product [Lepeophtheirus salmonis]
MLTNTTSLVSPIRTKKKADANKIKNINFPSRYDKLKKKSVVVRRKKISNNSDLVLFIILVNLAPSVMAQDFLSAHHSSNNVINHNQFGCDCMEYWTCILSGGTPYSYCGIHDHDVCCFVPDNAEPVGILPTANRARCGRKGFDSGNSGGADMAEWPWHAAILEKPQDLYVCGSTLLDESWVLTAAHCVDDYLPFVPTIQDILKVRLGEYDVSTTAEPLRHEEFNVTDIVMHPGFNNSTLVHDIALLKLERPAKRKQNIDVVCMPKSRDFNPSQFARCYVTGWGRRTETSEHSLVLKEIEVPLWSYTNCNGALKAQFGPAYSLPTTAICAGAEGRDACDGDGGGPLVCEKEGKWYQIGIVSFGIGCGRKNIPGVYTKVSEYDSWIENVYSWNTRYI